MRHGNATLFSIAPVTMSFLAVNIALFFITVMRAQTMGDFPSDVLGNLGSLHRELLWEGEWVRIVAPVFLHGGALHILLNSFALYQMGPSAENHFGSSNFGTLYLLSGIVGVCFSSMFGAGRSVGASGAIFGILAAELAVQIVKAPVLKNAWKRSEVRTCAAWLLLYFLMGVSGVMGSRIDNWGHFGGIVGGGIMGGLFELWRTRRRLGLPLVAGTLLSIAALICLARWSIYSPAYHIHQAWIAEEAGLTEVTAREYAEARRWAKTWNKEGVVETLIAGRERGIWGLHEARLYGYRYLEYLAAIHLQYQAPPAAILEEQP